MPLLSDSINLCSFCCVGSMEQEVEKQKAIAQEPTKRRRYIECRSCNKRFGSCCINGLFTYLTDHTTLHHYIKDHDTSYLALVHMNKSLISSGFTTIFRGPCCSFSQSIPEGTRTTFNISSPFSWFLSNSFLFLYLLFHTPTTTKRTKIDRVR